MGRSIKKKYINAQKNNLQTHYITCTAWPVGAGSAVACTILKQRSSNRFKVTDGTHTSVCKLVTGTPTAAGQMSVSVDPYVAPTVAATFAVHMEVNSVLLVATGSGYTAADVLSVVGGTGTAATITVDTVDGGGHILTYHLTAAAKGNYTALPSNPVSVTGGTGTLATFNLNYDVLSVTVSGGGTGYGANTEIVFHGGGYTTQATGTATVSGGHVITAVTVVNHGVGYTSIPTVDALSFGTTEYANKINNRTVETFQDHKYKWELTGTELTGTGTSNGPTSQGTGTLGEAFIQSV